MHNTVIISNLSHQRHRIEPYRTKPNRTEPYRTVPNRTEPYRTEPYRHFSKIPVLLKVTFFTHRCMQRYIEKYTVTSIVTLDCNGKYDRHMNCYSYYRHRTLKNNASRAPLQFWSRVTGIVTIFYKRYWHRYK